MNNEPNCSPSKLWFDQEKEFYNGLMKKLLDDNEILMCLT